MYNCADKPSRGCWPVYVDGRRVQCVQAPHSVEQDMTMVGFFLVDGECLRVIGTNDFGRGPGQVDQVKDF